MACQKLLEKKPKEGGQESILPSSTKGKLC